MFWIACIGGCQCDAIPLQEDGTNAFGLKTNKSRVGVHLFTKFFASMESLGITSVLVDLCVTSRPSP